MLQQSDQQHNASPRVERSAHRADVLARIVPGPDTSSRLSDLRNLARRYNAMLGQRHALIRIAR